MRQSMHKLEADYQWPIKADGNIKLVSNASKCIQLKLVNCFANQNIQTF